MWGSLIFRAVAHCFRTLSLVVFDLVRFAFLAAHSHTALAAENFFLRKQLALFQEREVKPRRGECLDYLIPINERHLKMAIKEWGTHYNRGRPHSSLGPGLPEPTQDSVPESGHRHKLPAGYRVVKDSVLGGLHHEYRLVKEAA